MARLIDADKLKAHYAWWKDGTREMTMAEAKDIIDEIVDLQPTARMTGHWVPTTNDQGGFDCNQCHGFAPSYNDGVEWLSNYCPHCGAKMDGRKDDADE